MIEKVKADRDEDYKAFIRMHVCCACKMLHGEKYAIHISRTKGTICAHIGRTGKGIATKCSDYETVPFCHEHHDTEHRIGKRRFEALIGVSLDMIAQKMREEYGISKDRPYIRAN
jgi:hypothetical protein